MSLPNSEFSWIKFYVLGNEDVKYLQTVKVRNHEGLKAGAPVPGGVYDAHMGSTFLEWKCESCGKSKDSSNGPCCPGHFGMMELNYPIINPLYQSEILKWLKSVCIKCSRLIMGDDKVSKPPLLNDYASKAKASKNACVHCGGEQRNPDYIKDKNDNTTILYKAKDSDEKKYLPPHIIENILNRITDETCKLMGVPLASHPRKFILRNLIISPNTIRPDRKKANGGKFSSDDITILLQTVAKANEALSNVGETIDEEMRKNINNLEFTVFEMIKGKSSGTAKRGIVIAGSNNQPSSITKRLQRKQGRIRKNLLGRRVVNVARSFITCGIELPLDCIGLPIQIASNIQIEVKVCDFNLDECRNYFRNGNRIYPKCTQVISPDGISYITEKVQDIYPGWTVKRDIITGDVIDFNRQPSLLGPSITSMKIVVYYEGGTIRLNVISCDLFNADFDGDAMNVLFAISAQARNEISRLNSPANFAIKDKDGTPFIGEVQDGIIGLASLTRSGVQLDKTHAMQMFSNIDVDIDFSKYPKNHVFTGRDIITLLLHGTGNFISYTGRASFYNKMHQKYIDYKPEDINIIIDRGTLKQGILDKASIGQGKHGNIFHIVNNKYGGEKALKLAHQMQQIANNYLFYYGLTVTMEDLILRKESLDAIHKIEETLIADSERISQALMDGEIVPPINTTTESHFEELQKNALDPSDMYWEHILSSIDAVRNNMYRMIMHGSKGKTFNFKNVSAALGQLEINGERMPVDFGFRSLPYFNRDDHDPSSRGYIKNSYSAGLTLTEFIHHSIENRYQLCMKALSTSVAGHQNRVSIKALEQAIINNHRQVATGPFIIQSIYGGDGIDPRFLENVSFPTMVKDLDDIKFAELYHHKSKDNQKLLDEEFEQLKKDRIDYFNIFSTLDKTGSGIYSHMNLMPVDIYRVIEDIKFNFQLIDTVNDKKSPVNNGKTSVNDGKTSVNDAKSSVNNAKTSVNNTKTSVNNLTIKTAIEKVRSLIDNLAYCYLNEIQEKKKAKIPEVVEHATFLMKIFIRSWLNIATLVKNNITDDALAKIVQDIRNTYMKAIINYGRPVGVIAAQSISEPTTQLVIDSHHTSGAGSTKKKGMFRIKEIESCTPTESMQSTSLNFSLTDEWKTNKDKNVEIAKKIEMLTFGTFISNWQIFYETFGEPEHPDYKHEAILFKEFFKYNPSAVKPSNLSNWCIRLEMNKFKMIEKQLTTYDIYTKLRMKHRDIYIIYSPDTAKNIVFRLFLHNDYNKGKLNLPLVKTVIGDLENIIIRGVNGINKADVIERKILKINEKGAIVDTMIYEIACNGTNIKSIIENPYVDPYTIQSNSIMETYEFLGIVATRQKVIDELCSQIEEPNIRHHQMYADIIANGVPNAMTRFKAIQRRAPVMLQMADASPVKVINEAAIKGMKDTLGLVSPDIMMGKNPEVGTLYNSFILDEQYIAENVEDIEKNIEDIDTYVQ